jgi:probable rRNA maturation factor
MSLDVDVTTDGVRSPLGRAAIADVARSALRAERIRHALLSITLVDKRAIARHNNEYLGHRGTTDVISFGFRRAADGDPVVGDVYIAPEIARENARAVGVGVREEIARLVVHGTLHVLGYDHPDGAGREGSPMWRRQERIMRRALKARRSR